MGNEFLLWTRRTWRSEAVNNPAKRGTTADAERAERNDLTNKKRKRKELAADFADLT
jgi:hypothetical protein